MVKGLVGLTYMLSVYAQHMWYDINKKYAENIETVSDMSVDVKLMNKDKVET